MQGKRHVGVQHGVSVPSWEMELLKARFVSREIPVLVNLYVSRCFDVTFISVPTVAHTQVSRYGGCEILVKILCFSSAGRNGGRQLDDLYTF